MNIAPISDAEDDDAGHGGNPEGRPGGECKS